MKKMSFDRKRKAGIARLVKRKELAELKAKKQTKTRHKKLARIAGLIVLFFVASLILFATGEAMFIDANGNVRVYNALQVDKNASITEKLTIGNVADGTAVPEAKLDVRGNTTIFGTCTAFAVMSVNDVVSTGGRFEDSTGEVMPVGAILSYYGETAPAGWLLCNGQTIPADTKYDSLRVLCGDTVPDLRGVFLRGFDDGREYDPDRELGSYQEDALRSHYHTILGSGEEANSNQDYRRIIIDDDHDGNTYEAHTEQKGVADETRPKNVAVNFIIKY